MKYTGSEGNLTAAEEFLKTVQKFHCCYSFLSLILIFQLHMVPRIKTKIDMILFRIEFEEMVSASEKVTYGLILFFVK